MYSLPPNVHLMQPWEDETYLSQDYTCIYQWMHRPEGLGMRFCNAECIVYARIWGASRNGTGVYCESQKKLAETFGFSRKTVNLALQELLRRGYITVVGIIGNEKTGIRAYRCDPIVANRAIAAIMDLDELRRSLSEERKAALAGGLPDPGATATVPEPAPSTGQAQPSGVPSPSPEAAAAAPASPSAPVPDVDAAPSAAQTPARSEQTPAAASCAGRAQGGLEASSRNASGLSAADRERGFNELLREYPKSCNGGYRRQARAEYDKLIDEGYSPEQILESLHAYLIDHRERNGGDLAANYLKSFQNFLAFANGARRYLSEIANRRGTARGPAAGASEGPSFCRITNDRGPDTWVANGPGVPPFELLAPHDATREQLLDAYSREVTHVAK